MRIEHNNLLETLAFMTNRSDGCQNKCSMLMYIKEPFECYPLIRCIHGPVVLKKGFIKPIYIHIKPRCLY